MRAPDWEPRRQCRLSRTARCSIRTAACCSIRTAVLSARLFYTRMPVDTYLHRSLSLSLSLDKCTLFDRLHSASRDEYRPVRDSEFSDRRISQIVLRRQAG